MISIGKIKSIVKSMSSKEIAMYDWDKLAFGFRVGDIITLPISKIRVKYKDDMLNTSGSMKDYFKSISYSDLPPIEVSYEKGEFFIEDGHHRYVYAKQLGLKDIPVYIDDIKDNSILALGFNGTDDIIKLSTLKEKININSNFKKWFRNSVVVNDDGSPKIVYHGTIRDFKNESREDDLTFIPSIRNDIGSHFGNKDQANLLLAGGEEERVLDPSKIDLESEYYKGARVIPCYIRMEKPLYLEDLITWDIISMQEVFVEYNILSPAMIKKLVNQYNQTYMGVDNRPENADEIQKNIKDIMIRALENAGYDGIVYENLAEGEGESYMVFRPNQIKSIYNKGMWSTNNNRINEYMAVDREELISRNLKQIKIWGDLAGLGLVEKSDLHMFRLFAKFFNDFRDENGYDMDLEDALLILGEKDIMNEDVLLEYIHYEKGHKNSKGILSPWIIRDHETNALIGSYRTQAIAKKVLKNMNYFTYKE